MTTPTATCVSTTRRLRATVAILLTSCSMCFTLLAAPASAQEMQHRVFAPLLADPKQPHFFAAWLSVKSPTVTGSVASVGLGEDLRFLRGRDARWELSVAAGAFSQFNMDTRSIDLINTDFTIGFPFAYRAGPASLRVRLYHQSSHLGDEFILNTNPTRVNLSFEALEGLASRELGPVRIYGGGEYLVRHEPADLKPGLLHAGAEFRRSVHGARSGLIAALDAKSTEEREWRIGWSVRLGWEWQLAVAGTVIRSASVQLQGYTGPAPYGQFYQENVRSVGLGIHLAL